MKWTVVLIMSGLLSGCASAPKFSAGLASDPQYRTGWSAPPICYHICRSSSSLVRITWDLK